MVGERERRRGGGVSWVGCQVRGGGPGAGGVYGWAGRGWASWLVRASSLGGSIRTGIKYILV